MTVLRDLHLLSFSFSGPNCRLVLEFLRKKLVLEFDACPGIKLKFLVFVLEECIPVL